MAFDGFTAEVDANVDEAYEASQSSGDRSFAPLPKGRYQAVIVPLKKDGSQLTEVAPFGGQGANASKKILRVAFKIVEDSPTGKNRWFSARVPMFTRYAPSQKNPAGASARGYWDFWTKFVGRPVDEAKSGSFQVGSRELMGLRGTITLSEPVAPDKWNELGSNEVSFFDAADADTSKTPLRIPGKSVAPWLDADDNLLPDWTPSTPKPTVGAPTQGWAGAGATTTAPAPTPSWGQQASPLQQAATAGVTY